jgi:hypothetical protein
MWELKECKKERKLLAVAPLLQVLCVSAAAAAAASVSVAVTAAHAIRRTLLCSAARWLYATAISATVAVAAAVSSASHSR